MADAITIEKRPRPTIERAKQIYQKAKETDVKGTMHSAVEIHQKAATPLYLGLTVGSIIFSLLLYWRKKKDEAVFVGLWAPTFMGLGLLSKLSDLRKATFRITSP